MSTTALDRDGFAISMDEAAGPRRLLGLRAVALGELALFFAVALAADALFGSGQRFDGVQPHPFWLPVLLLSVQYGTGEGVLAALAAAAALRIGNMPEQLITQDVYEYLYAVTREPILWLVAAVMVGELRMRQLSERETLRADLARARREAEAIATSYRQLKAVKETLETRVAGQLRTVVTLHRAARAIDELDEGGVMLGVADLIRTVMGAEKFSLFLLNDDLLEAVTSEGWAEDDHYARGFDPTSPLFEAVIARQRFVCVARGEDERVLQGEGVLAGPLISAETGAVVGMVKIESLGFMDLGLNSVENFRVLCEWVGTALAKARQFREASEQRLFTDDGTLYSAGYIGRQAVFLAQLGRRLGFETSMIIVRPTGIARLGPAQRRAVAAAIGTAARESLRDTDLACDVGHNGLAYGVVLPGTAVEQARIVAGKLEAAVRASLPPALADVAIRFEVEKVGAA